mmetsp:Transcript_26265/g.35055  ORF Transcript_26265/g.35055 Transcript_26265/m.35055 type:complete len:215 (-) Transcript_26265:1057-1701(-)
MGAGPRLLIGRRCLGPLLMPRDFLEKFFMPIGALEGAFLGRPLVIRSIEGSFESTKRFILTGAIFWSLDLVVEISSDLRSFIARRLSYASCEPLTLRDSARSVRGIRMGLRLRSGRSALSGLAFLSTPRMRSMRLSSTLSVLILRTGRTLGLEASLRPERAFLTGLGPLIRSIRLESSSSVSRSGRLARSGRFLLMERGVLTVLGLRLSSPMRF